MERMRNFGWTVLPLALFGCDARKGDSEPAGNVVQMEMAAAAETAIIGTRDGRKVYLDHVPVPNARATIILLHQAGSSGYEYMGIASRLNAAGFSTVIVDLRSGGSLYGPNRTVSKYGKSDANYLNALPDIEAALNWSRLQGPPVILMGSSYSASLCLRVAADNPTRVAAVLAFSPGEYFPERHYTRDAARRLTAPVYISQATQPDEIAQSRAIFESLASTQKTMFVAKSGGFHGASTLRPDRNPQGESENWEAMMRFLKSIDLS